MSAYTNLVQLLHKSGIQGKISFRYHRVGEKPVAQYVKVELLTVLLKTTTDGIIAKYGKNFVNGSGKLHYLDVTGKQHRVNLNSVAAEHVAWVSTTGALATFQQYKSEMPKFSEIAQVVKTRGYAIVDFDQTYLHKVEDILTQFKKEGCFVFIAKGQRQHQLAVGKRLAGDMKIATPGSKNCRDLRFRGYQIVLDGAALENPVYVLWYPYPISKQVAA